MKPPAANCPAVCTFVLSLLSAALLLPLRAPAQTDVKASAPAPEASAESKLQAIILPSLDLNRARIEIVVQVLNARGVELDPAKQGVPIVLKLNGKTADQIPQVSFHAKQISLLNALKTVSQMAGLDLRLDGNLVFLEAK